MGRNKGQLISPMTLIVVTISDSKNFMKTLMQMFAEEDKGVVFYETVTNLRWQKHTIIECVPLSWEKFDDIPQFFKV